MRKSRLERILRKRFALCKRRGLKIYLAETNERNALKKYCLYCDDESDKEAQIRIEERKFLYRKQMNGVYYHNIFPHYFFNEKYGNCRKVFHKLLTRLRRKMKSFYRVEYEIH